MITHRSIIALCIILLSACNSTNQTTQHKQTSDLLTLDFEVFVFLPAGIDAPPIEPALHPLVDIYADQGIELVYTVELIQAKLKLPAIREGHFEIDRLARYKIASEWGLTNKTRKLSIVIMFIQEDTPLLPKYYGDNPFIQGFAGPGGVVYIRWPDNGDDYEDPDIIYQWSWLISHEIGELFGMDHIDTDDSVMGHLHSTVDHNSQGWQHIKQCLNYNQDNEQVSRSR